MGKKPITLPQLLGLMALFSISVIASALLLKPALMKPLEARERQLQQQAMLAYAEEVGKFLQGYRHSLQDYPLYAWPLNNFFHDKIASPYPPKFGNVRVVSCDQRGNPVEEVEDLFVKIGYYSDGTHYKLFVWDLSGKIIAVISDQLATV